MLLFRSEEHVAHWCSERGVERGAVFDLARQWKLARRWYDDRLELPWKRRSVPERQAILRDVGLTGAFWEIEPD